MAITEQQRQTRSAHIGSSDSSAVLGVCPFRTPHDVWLEKTGRLPRECRESKAIEIGNAFEPALINWASGELQVQVEMSPETIIHPDGILCANLDARIVGLPQAIEAKTTGLVAFKSVHGWGDPGTDEVPENVLIQAQHQMVVADLELVWVPVLIGGRGILLYRVERNEELGQIIGERASDFWNRHVVTDTPPDDSMPALENLKRRVRSSGVEVAIAESLVTAWAEAKDSRLRAENTEEAAYKAILAALGDAEIGKCGLGDVTYFEQKRKGYTVKDGSFRVLKFKYLK